MSQPAVVCKRASYPTRIKTTDLVLWDKMEEKNKKWCKPALTSTNEVLKVAPFQNSMYFRARILQSYL